MTAAITASSLSPVGAVGDDADVEARELAHHAREERAAEDLAAARLVRRADEDVGGAALAGDAADGGDEVVAFLFEEVGAEDAGEPPERRELRCLLGAWARARACGPRRRPSSAPSRWAERQARRMIRCDFACGSTRARMRSATACWLSGSSVRATRRASTSSATSSQGELAQRGEVVAAEEVVERDLGTLLRIDLAGARRSCSSSGERSTSTTSSASSRIRSGNVSRTRISVSSKIASLRLSRCWTLTVEMTSMPASRTSSMSC